MSDQAPAKRMGNPAWVKGVSGNPKGRPRVGLALAERIRERLDPDILIDLAARVAADETLSPERRIEVLSPVYAMGFVKPPVGVHAKIETSTDSSSRQDYHALPLDERKRRLAVSHAALRGDYDISRVRDPKVLDGGVTLLPSPVAIAVAVTDEE